jgi:hypothetical protein
MSSDTDALQLEPTGIDPCSYRIERETGEDKFESEYYRVGDAPGGIIYKSAGVTNSKTCGMFEI